MGRGVGHLLYVVVRESATILELPASKDQALLVRGDALLVLNLGLNEDLHPTMEMEHEMGVGEGVTILGLLTSEDQALLVRRDTTKGVREET